MKRAALFFAATLTACSGDWTVPCDLAPKEPLNTQTDCAGAERIPWSGPQDFDGGLLDAATVEDDAGGGDAGDGGAP